MSQKVKTGKNQIKVSFGKPKYYVNEAKRTVTCVLDYDLQVPMPTNYWQVINDTTFKGLCGTVTGTARCSEDDKFNTEVGMEIASSRAEQKAYVKCVTFLQKQWDNHMVYKKMLDDFTEKGRGVVSHNEVYINRIASKADESKN